MGTSDPNPRTYTIENVKELLRLILLSDYSTYGGNTLDGKTIDQDRENWWALCADIKLAYQRLPPDQRKAVWVRAVLGHSNRTLARKYGGKPGDYLNTHPAPKALQGLAAIAQHLNA